MQRNKPPMKKTSVKSARGPARKPRNRDTAISRAPAAQSITLRPRQPQFRSSTGGVTISHREMIGYIKRDPGVSDFSSLSFYCQPGAYAAFPWLSAIAGRFETYSFSKLIYHVSSRLPSVVPGSIGACFDHDPLDPVPVTLVAALAMRDHYASSAWNSWSFPIDLSRSHRPFYYTRTTDTLSGDRKTYDTGRVTFFTEGLDTDSTAAILEVEYTIHLYTPQLDMYEGTSGTARSSEGITADNILGTNFTAVSTEAAKVLPVRVYDADSRTLEFIRPFEGLLNVFMQGTDFTAGITTPQASKGARSDPEASAPAWTVLHDLWNSTQKSRSQKIKFSVGDIIRFASGGGSSSMSLTDIDFGEGRYLALA